MSEYFWMIMNKVLQYGYYKMHKKDVYWLSICKQIVLFQYFAIKGSFTFFLIPTLIFFGFHSMAYDYEYKQSLF